MTRRVPFSFALVAASLPWVGCGGDPSGPQQPTDPPRLARFEILSRGNTSDTIGAELGPVQLMVTDTTGALLPDAVVRISANVVDARPTLLVSTEPGEPAHSITLVQPGPDGTFTLYVALGTRAGPTRLEMTELTTRAGSVTTFQVLPGAAERVDVLPTSGDGIVGDSISVHAVAWDRADNVLTRAVTFSASGSAVVVGNRVIGTSSGYATIVGSIDGADDTLHMRFLPAGRIVYRSGSVLAASRLDGSQAETMEVFTGMVDAAPVGRLAAFAANGRIFYASFPDVVQRITHSSIESIVHEERHPAFARDGRVYFMAQGEHVGWAVWRVDVDGANPEQLTFPVAESLSHRYPAPSTQGERIVYVEGENEGPGPLYVHDVASGVATPLGVMGLFSRWSPDDEWIAYTDPLGRLRRIRPDGTDDQEIVHESISFPHPFAWSPDGQYILASGSDNRPRVIVVETGQQVPLPLSGTIGAMAWYAAP